jgi:hydroxymethylbilane synthase
MAQTRLIRIGTRGSKLALWQAGAVRDALVAAHGFKTDAIEVVPIRTSGDRIRDRALDEVGGKGLFTKEIQEALLSGGIDVAVHSAKDMETFLPAGLMIGAVLEREDARDALIARNIKSIDALPQGATIGSASIRREALLRRVRPDLRFALLRGNVPTRLKRVEDGDFDATLLAVAGLNRLGLQDHIAACLPIEEFLPACGQGVVAAECRTDDAAMRERLAAIDHRATSAALACERAFLAALDGSCRSPIAGNARMEDGCLRFDGMLLAVDGGEHYEANVAGAVEDAEMIGEAAGKEILHRAPPSFLKRIGVG